MEKLIDELHFEVCDVEASIVIRIELIGKIQHDLIPLALLARVNELVYQSRAYVLDFAMACDQTVKFELNLICSIQIRYAFLLVRDQHALK